MSGVDVPEDFFVFRFTVGGRVLDRRSFQLLFLRFKGCKVFMVSFSPHAIRNHPANSVTPLCDITTGCLIEVKMDEPNKCHDFPFILTTIDFAASY